MILKGVDQNWAQVIQGALIVVVVMIGGLAIRQKGEAARDDRPRRAARSRAARVRAARSVDNPAIVARRSSSSALFVVTDIVNRAQDGQRS